MRIYAILFLTLFALAGQSWAGLIPVSNPGFESPVLAAPGDTGVPDGWTIAGFANAFRPDVGSVFNSIPEGNQVAYSNGGTISQTLSATLTTGTVYTLSVQVGNRMDCPICTFAPIVQLYAGSTLIATGDVPTPGAGDFGTSTAVYTSGIGDPLAGQQLRIVLSAGAAQTNFDDVQLDATATPEPSVLTLFGIGLTGLIIGRRRFGRS